MSEPQVKRQKKERKPLILNFFQALTPVLHAPGQWKNPRDESRNYTKPEHWIKLAQIAERGKIHSIFFGDSLAIYGGYKSQGLGGPYNYEEAARTGNNFPKNDPTAYLAAVAISTKNVSMGITCSTLSEHPYHFARRAATLDHISGGRFGWNVVTSKLPSAGRQLTADNKMPEKDLRYEKADEYLQVVYELLCSSWRDDALVWDTKRGIVTDPERLREINHDGTHYRVPGPQITEPTEGRLPLIIQAGASPKGRHLGAKHAEVIYLDGADPLKARQQIEETKKLAKEVYGRNPDHLKFVTRLRVVVDETHEKAAARAEEIEKYHDLEGVLVQVGGAGMDLSPYDWDEDLTKAEDPTIKNFAEAFKGRDHYKEGDIITRRYVAQTFFLPNYCVGDPKEVADKIEDYVNKSGVDGFNFSNVVFPETFENIVDYLIPELQARGLAQKEYNVEGGSYREQCFGAGQKFVPEDHFAYPYRWNAGESKEEFEKRIESLKEKEEKTRITA